MLRQFIIPNYFLGLIIFIFSVTCPINWTIAFAANITGSDNPLTKEGDEWLDAHEQGMKLLASKIKVLEQEVSQLKQQIALLEKENNSNISVQEKRNVEKLQQPFSDEKQTYDLALATFKEQKFEEAEKKFEAFIQQYPKSSLQSNAYFWYGESFFRRKIFDKAAINYLKGYTKFPKDTKSADSLLKLALSLGEINNTKEACKILKKLEVEFPNRALSSKKRAEDARMKFGCAG